MARQNHGPLSRAKGKLGGVVYQQYEGMQISREYQPVVKNPQTTKQVENRAKFKISSQILAQFKDVITTRLIPLSIYTRVKRASAVNAIYKIISTATPSTPSALVDAVVSAINAKSVSSDYNVDVSESTSEFSITANSGYIVVYTHAGYSSNGELAYLKSETYTSTGDAKAVPFEGYTNEVVMVTGFKALTEAGRATISNTDFNAAGNGWQIAISRGVATGDIVVANINAETHHSA